jgi:hypothetical protein
MEGMIHYEFISSKETTGQIAQLHVMNLLQKKKSRKKAKYFVEKVNFT